MAERNPTKARMVRIKACDLKPSTPADLERLRRAAAGPIDTSDIPELTAEDFKRMIGHQQRLRIMAGDLRPGDVAALRRFVRLSQVDFAHALGISVHTLQNWEQGRRRPEGPAMALLRIAARHPRVLRENLAAAA